MKFTLAVSGLCVAAVLLEGTMLRAADEEAELKPTAANVSYGPDELNVIDFWKAEGEGPRPILIHIHGGGWTGGDKALKADAVKPFLEKGISYASINYRLTGKHPLPAPVHDAARAVQFIRSKAKEWNIDKTRVALTGGSAGACTSMWLLLHDDLADPKSHDPIARESTRVTAAAVAAGQTSIDPKVIEPWLGPNVLKHRMINMAVGEKTIEGALENYEKHKALFVEFSPYTHMSAGDPPLLMTYGGDMTLPSKDAGHGIHHPVYGVKLKEKADQVGVECHLLIPGHSKSEKYPNPNAFLMEKLLGGESTAALPKADKDGWISLFDGKTLAGWTETKFGGEGDVLLKDGAIVLTQGNDMTGVTITRKDLPTSNYEIRVDARRVQGNDFFCGLTFPVKKDPCSLILGGWGGGVCGLSSIDGLDASENSTSSGREFEKGKWYTIRLQVTDSMITAWIDSEKVLEQELEGRRISIRSEVDLSRPLGFSTWRTTGELKNIRLKKLDKPKD